MKRILSILAAASIFSGVGLAVAGQVYDRSTVTLAAATGLGAFTNTTQYTALKVMRLWDYANLVAANTVTVYRANYGTTVSQLVASVFVASNAGDTNADPICWLKYGDRLTFSSTAVTGSSVIVDYEVQRH